MKNYWLERKETKNLILFEVDDGEQHWYSAESFDEAARMHSKLHGIGWTKTNRVDPDKLIAVRQEDVCLPAIVKTAAEWAAEGKGLVASTVY